MESDTCSFSFLSYEFLLSPATPILKDELGKALSRNFCAVGFCVLDLWEGLAHWQAKDGHPGTGSPQLVPRKLG